ncbi:MAG: YncE family protein [Spartobacteria bacterium]
MKRRIFIGLTLAALSHFATAQEYKLLKSVPIGGEGGWDLLSLDAKARKLYVTHASKIVIVDLAQDKVAGEILDTPGVHACAIASDLGFGFSTNGAESRVSVIDLNKMKAGQKIETGESPDAILYEPTRSEVYVFNARGKSATVIAAKNKKVEATIPLPGQPELPAADPDGSRVFCNIEDKNEVAVIDAKTHAVKAEWPLAPGEEPTGLAFDAVHHRLFAACHNKMLVMLDSDSGKVISTLPIGAGVDGCAFDEKTQLVLASCGDGTMTIAKEETPEKLSVVQTLTTERGARTMALDPTTHRIYTCTAETAPETPSTTPTPSPAERRRPNYVAGTFHLLVYGTE